MHETQTRKCQIQCTAISGYRHIGILPSHITQPVPSTTITTTPGSRNPKITGGYVERSEKHLERDMRRRDINKYIEDLAQQAEEAAGKKNFKELYLTTKKLTGKLKQTQVLKYTHRDPSSQPRKTN